MIVLRLARGIRAHFPVRVLEWLMTVPLLTMGGALLGQPGMFARSQSYDQLARWMDQGHWAALVLACAAVRLAALVVNGTFQRFPYSPHLRIAASAIAGLFWVQVVVGFAVSLIEDGGAASPLNYTVFVLAEAVAIYRASQDLGGGRACRVC